MGRCGEWQQGSPPFIGAVRQWPASKWGEELTIVNSAISKHGGGVRAELRRALKAGSTVGHLAMARRWATLGRLGEEEGSPPPPEVGQVDRAADGRLG
jgi:hypothetical protein